MRSPPGLGELSPALRDLASFLRLDQDLLAVADGGAPEHAARQDAVAEFQQRLTALRLEHGRKYSFIERLDRAGLTPPRAAVAR